VIKVYIVDEGGETADVESKVLVQVHPQGGEFVVGDLTARAAVTFWGAQWSKVNGLSGGGGPAAFKAFANEVGPSAPSWTTAPGNSSKPPVTLPSYMALIVSSRVTRRRTVQPR
jgi:hypothetical protein